VNVHQSRGELAAGREPLRLLYRQDPRREVRRLLAGALWAAGDTAAVVALLDTLPAAELSDVELMLLIQGDRHLGLADRALDWVRRDRQQPLDGRSPDPDFWAIAAEICLDAGHPHEALAAIDRALSGAAAEAVYHHNRAAILLALGRQDEAEQALTTARRLGAAIDDRP
jgi:predicted Zn-dependent protease